MHHSIWITLLAGTSIALSAPARQPLASAAATIKPSFANTSTPNLSARVTTTEATNTTKFVTSSSSSTSNPFSGKEFYANTDYKSKIQTEYNALVSEGKTTLAAKVAKLTSVSTAIWIASRALVSSISTHFQAALNVQNQTGKKQIVPLVIYDLPDRDCAAGASGGEFSSANGGEAKYQEYITAVATQIKAFPNISVAVILEPDSVGNLVSNQGIVFCANGAAVQKRSLAYAISVLGVLPTVSIYLDAAHARWLGWPDSLAPTAKIVGDIYAAARKLNPSAIVRGLATDISNYNGRDQENAYHTSLAPYLNAVEYPAHFVVDQGRSGNQNVTRISNDWCNLKSAGLGIRPTASTNSSTMDAILWIKPPGNSDGNSSPTSSHYDPACASNTSYVPSPDPGAWASGAFRSMVQLANPAL